ncbi:uncharacterized protein LOC121860777 isoform X2 [Homarus americanus]|uniref:uncharacterized protein LOC121860777 isoform X2 n=1 Tax=Homarus americanus TaxID=6706 RepID=UPI001C4392BD|nr:uncharacterized protein LOC121860777 isoform X2 [Homarus americanus]
MESECDSETLDVEEKMKTISTCKPKRQRERDSTTGSTTSPPPKKSQQSLNSSFQPSEEYLHSTTVPCKARGLSEYSEGKSELNDRLVEGNTHECNQLNSEPAVACSNITSTGTSSYNTTPEHPSVKVADTRYHKMLTSLPGMSGSNLSLSKSVSGDSLDQEFSWGESENISSGVFETECESLTSSQVLPDGEAKESKTLIDAVKILDGTEEIVSSTKKDKRKRTKERKRKNWKKQGKKAVDSVDGEETKSKNVRANYFLAIQVTNADIHKAIVKVQEDMMASYEFLARSFVDVATSHLTLLVAHIDTEESLTVAQSAVEECCSRVMEEVRAKPILLTFSGVSNFSNQVVFAQLVEDEEYHRLLKFAESVRNVFSEKGVCMPDTKALNPHLTISKLSKASRVKAYYTTDRPFMLQAASRPSFWLSNSVWPPAVVYGKIEG